MIVGTLRPHGENLIAAPHQKYLFIVHLAGGHGAISRSASANPFFKLGLGSSLIACFDGSSKGGVAPANSRTREDAVCCYRNFISASVVSFGFSSRIQCPVSFSTIMVALLATIFICCPNNVPFAFSPPIASTGMDSLVLDSWEKSFAAC